MLHGRLADGDTEVANFTMTSDGRVAKMWLNFVAWLVMR